MRAVAILVVVAFHAAPHVAPGGYMGVDVFFVISGFLITSILLGEFDADEFALSKFYARRIRRLFPALLVVLVAVAAVGWFYLLPHEFRRLGDLISAGAAYFANFKLNEDTGYFDVDAVQKPLLHLWSLAIEEQFCLLYPVVLAASMRLGARGAVVSLASLAALSFGLEVHETARKAAAAFYLPQYRAWELLVGGLLAMIERRGHSTIGLPEVARGALSLAGFAAILSVVAFAPPGLTFPGVWPLLPCFGTCAVIAAGPNALVNRYLLGHPLACAIGLISYSLYLWHWPLLSFVAIVGAGGRAAALVLAFILAIATYLFVESRVADCRFGRRHLCCSRPCGSRR